MRGWGCHGRSLGLGHAHCAGGRLARPSRLLHVPPAQLLLCRKDEPHRPAIRVIQAYLLGSVHGGLKKHDSHTEHADTLVGGAGCGHNAAT